MNSQPSDKLSAIKKFAIGILTGLFIAGIFWLYSIYFHVPISLVQGIIGSSLLAISCGIIATVSGLDKLFDNFPNI
jgi:phosphate/sulfate permease